MKMKIDKRVAPEEFIVGHAKGDTDGLSYFTFNEGVKKIRLNSETSWRQWSGNSDNPTVFENKFSDGFKLNGINTRWSTQAVNKDHMLITHPLCGFDFELPMSAFLQVAAETTIINGVWQDELILNKDRILMTKSHYAEAVAKEEKLADELAARRVDGKENRVHKNDQLIGHIYIDDKKREWLYLGRVRISDNLIKHVYIDTKDYPFGKEFTAKLRTYESHRNKRNDYVNTYFDSFPSIIQSAHGDKGYQGREITTSQGIYSHQRHWGSTSVVKSKKTLAMLPDGKSDIDYFLDYSPSDWELIDKVWSRRSETRLSWYSYHREEDRFNDKNYSSDVKQFHGTNEQYEILFWQDYLVQKEKQNA